MVSSVRPLYKSSIQLPLGTTQTTAQKYPSPNVLRSELSLSHTPVGISLTDIGPTVGPWDVLGPYRIIWGSHGPSPLTILSPKVTSVPGKSLQDSNFLIQMQAPSMAGLGLSPGFTGPCFEVPSGLLHTSLQGSEVPSPFWASLGPHLPCIILQAHLLANKPRMALKVLLISSAARRLFSQFLAHH